MSIQEWGPFLEAFDEIIVLARVENDYCDDEGYIIDETKTTVRPLPYYDGLFDYFRKWHRIRKYVADQVRDPNAVYSVRIPCILALPAAKRVKRLNAPLIARVRGDAGGVARAILPFPINEFVAKLSTCRSKRAVLLADGVIYVTLQTMQRMYPARPEALTLARTSMHFTPELLSIGKKDRIRKQGSGSFSLIAVGSQQQNYKGHDILIDAVTELQKEGYAVSLTLVGDGRLHTHLQEQARQNGLREVAFVKHLGTSVDVARHVKNYDLFVMPSRTEAMPKALLEAMSVGVLSIGSSVGGIPEVLGQKSTFSPDSVSALREAIRRMIDDENMAEHQRDLQSEMIESVRKNHSGSIVLTQFLESFVRSELPHI